MLPACLPACLPGKKSVNLEFRSANFHPSEQLSKKYKSNLYTSAVWPSDKACAADQEHAPRTGFGHLGTEKKNNAPRLESGGTHPETMRRAEDLQHPQKKEYATQRIWSHPNRGNAPRRGSRDRRYEEKKPWPRFSYVMKSNRTAVRGSRF